LSVKLDESIAESGTRFKVFPQPRILGIFPEPETITISIPPRMIHPGPADERVYVVDALEKSPYQLDYRPPYIGPATSPVVAGPDGHFDHIDYHDRAFLSATMYGTVHRVLDIWEDYFGKHFGWHFEPALGRLELIPLVVWGNAHAGPGFLEFGYAKGPNGQLDFSQPHCENFDIVAHELGHSLVFSEIGSPSNAAVTNEFFGFHESVSDLVATIAIMHFKSVVDYALDQTAGNLFTINLLNRIGELNRSFQLRLTLNDRLMSNVDFSKPHELSKPLTGAVFDVFVEVYQSLLVQLEAISPVLAQESQHIPGKMSTSAATQAKFDRAYEHSADAFRWALYTARDYLGNTLAHAWSRLDPEFFTYAKLAQTLLNSDNEISGGRYHAIWKTAFSRRGISLAPTIPVIRPNPFESRSAIST
jgi:hypothetical protein